MLRKIMTFIILLAIYTAIPYFQEPANRYVVELSYVVDGDTMYFVENGIESKYRLLYIDTPEATTEIEPYGLEATNYAKQLLEEADVIEIEYQEDNDTIDKYGRKLAWVFVDGQLLQEKLASAGLVEKTYDNGGRYTYKKEILKAIELAKENKEGIYLD